MLLHESMSDREAKARACEEVLHSRTFARSEQLVQFLRYICDLELDGRGAEITEYSIATCALHRPADYAPGEDSSVRSRAHALRRKLVEYYEAENPEAGIRIELPKGSYRPAFVTRVETRKEAPARFVRSRSPWWTALALAAVILGGLALATLYRPDPIDPVVRAAWGPLLKPGADVLVIMSNRPVLRIAPSQPGVKPQSTVDAAAPEWVEPWYDRLDLEKRGGPLYIAASMGYSLSIDAFAAMTVSSLLGAAGSSHHPLPGSSAQASAIHETGLVIIGAPAYTTYLARILAATPYSIWFDPERNDEVLGRRGVAQSPVYVAKRNPSTNRYSTVYGLVTVLPSQPGRTRPERTLIFAGFSGSPGAQAGVRYFTSPEALEDLERRFRQQGFDTFPPAYQVVVRCGVDAETAINTVYETHIVLPKVPLIE